MSLQDQQKKAAESHETLKNDLGKKYPGAYDATANTIDLARMSKEDQMAYAQSKANRENLIQKVKEIEKIETASLLASQKHDQLKNDLGKKYPGTYNAVANTINTTNWSDEDRDTYQQSRENRDKKIAEKEAAEQKITNKAVAENFPANTPAVDANLPCKNKEPETEKQQPKEHFINFKLIDDKGKPIRNVVIEGVLPGDEPFRIATGSAVNGVIEIKNIKPGEVIVHSNWKKLTIEEIVMIQ